MANLYTKAIGLRVRELGSILPGRVALNWAKALNDELERIDAVLGKVCTPAQLIAIREKLKGEEGVIL